MEQQHIIDQINDLMNFEKVALWNEYCDANYYHNDRIHGNDDDFLQFTFGSMMDLARAITNGDYRYNDDFVIFNDHEELRSFDNPDQYIDFEELAEFLTQYERIAYQYGIELEKEE